MDITYIFKYLWNKKWLIIIPTFIGLVGTWIFTRNITPTYTTVAEISTGYMDDGLLTNSRNANKSVLFNNVMQTLKSSQILDQVTYRLLLHDLNDKVPFKKLENSSNQEQIISNFPGGKSGLLAALSQREDSFHVLNLALNEDKIISKLASLYQYGSNALSNKIKLERIDGSDFIKLTAVTTNPGLSAFVANSVFQEFLQLYQNRQGMASGNSLDTLRRLVATKKRMLDTKLQLLGSGNDISQSSSQELLSTLRSQLNRQNESLIAAKVALESVEKQMNQTNAESGLLNNEEIIAIRRSIDELYTRYVNGGSKDPNLLSQVEVLRAKLQQRLSTSGYSSSGSSTSALQRQKNDLEVKINVASRTMEDLRTKIKVLEGNVYSSAAQEGVLKGIQSEIEVAQQQYLEANKLYSDALNHTLFPGNDFSQVLHASPPLYPDPSNKLKTIGLAGAGILFISVFLLLFFDFINPSIKTPLNLITQTGLPLLATLGIVKLKNRRIDELFLDGTLNSNDTIDYLDTIKQLRYEIEHSGLQMILMASCHAKSGKTTILEALAVGLSMNKRKVLLIDANLKNNTLSLKYRADTSIENELPSESTKSNEVLEDYIDDTGLNNIGLVGCAQTIHTPSEILPTNNILKFLGQNKMSYDYVLIDCASLDLGPDCRELLAYADGVILNFAADQKLERIDKDFISKLVKDKNLFVLGAILNRVKRLNMCG